MKLGYYARRTANGAFTRRLIRAWPFIGGAVAVLMVLGTIRRKGFVGGTVDTALNVVPYVGTMKHLIEAGRGRDFIPARTTRPRTNAQARDQIPQ
jgi:hypothetical protein